MKIVTHSGHFHSDDLFAVSVLLMKFPGAEVVRSRDDKIIESANIAVDVGQIYDPEKFRFDHHQASGSGVRPNGIPYASLGLVWKAFGEEISGGTDPAKIIDEKIVMPVDAADNGVNLYTPLFEGVKEYSMGDYFNSFSYGCKTLEDFDKSFFAALPLASELLQREIAAAKNAAANWEEIRRIYAESENKKIITLPVMMHWKRVLIPLEAYYVVYPNPIGQWVVRAIPSGIHTFELKKSFPRSWSGLRGEALQEVTGLKDAVFCHRDCYLAITETQESAKKLAEIALNA